MEMTTEKPGPATAGVPTGRRGPGVLLIPHLGEGNPYLRLLSEAIEGEGVTVSLARWRRGPTLLRAVWRNGLPAVIHLQWHHRFFVPHSGRRLVALGRSFGFFLEWLVLRVSGVRFVWTVHNIVNHERRLARWELAASRLLARCVDAMVVHCRAAAEDVAQAYRIPVGQVWVVPHAHFASSYPPPPERGEARRQLGLPGSAKVFLYFGLIREYKGVDTLLRTFSELDGAELRLLIVGSPRTPALEEMVRSLAARDSRVVTHLEFVDDERLVTYLGACDAVVLPYTDSLTSGAATLASSYARPVIMPHLGCAHSLPVDACLTYDPSKPNGLRETLYRAISAPLEQMGRAAERHARQYTWEGMARQLLGVYSSVSRAPDLRRS